MDLLLDIDCDIWTQETRYCNDAPVGIHDIADLVIPRGIMLLMVD